MALPPRQTAPHPGPLPEGDRKSREFMDKMIKDAVDSLPALSETLEEFWTPIPTSDGWQSRCKVIQPKAMTNSTKGRPLIVYFYGGGYKNGNPDMVTLPARDWAEQHNATVVCPTYRLTPEWTWPMSFTDGWDVVSWLASNAETDERFRRVNLEDGFILGGVSAGGGVASIVGGISALQNFNDGGDKAYLEVERLAKPITGLFVCIALFLTDEIVPEEYKEVFTSREDNRYAENVNTAAVEGVIESLRCSDFTSPWFSPINVLTKLAGPSQSGASASDVKPTRVNPHPRTYIQSCGLDPLRDDTIIYSKMLSSLPGMTNEVKIDLFPDDPHAATTAIPYPSKSTNPTISEATMKGMEWLLQ